MFRCLADIGEAIEVYQINAECNVFLLAYFFSMTMKMIVWKNFVILEKKINFLSTSIFFL